MQSPDTYNQIYKNYLPGKKIRIVLLVILLGVITYFVIFPLIKKIKRDGIPEAVPLSLKIVLPSGDPTTRDSDNDTIVDWQEIAVGLDPQKKETSRGTPDAQIFEFLKDKLGQEAFDKAAKESSTTDKISLTIAHTLDQSVLNGSTIDQSLSEASINEILNYIESQKKTFVTYASNDITIVENSLLNNQKYASSMKVLLSGSAATDNTLSDIKDYASGEGSLQKINIAKNAMSTAITQMKSMPTPSAVSTIHLDILNSLQGFYQATESINPSNTDEVTRLGTLSILQDYAIQMATNIGKLSIYLSIALNKNGYIQ